MRSRTPFAVLCMPFFLVSGAHAQFTPGHIFVSVQSSEPCRAEFAEAIFEIDPTTGDVSIFADRDDGICGVNGLRFTPDGTRLLTLNSGPSGGGSSSIRAFNPDGTSEVILDGSDGISSPLGVNGLAFDKAGDLYVVNAGNHRIMRFPGGVGPGVVFADVTDGISRPGALDFAPNGDLFYASDSDNPILRISPDGVASIFDSDAPRPLSSLAIDRAGNLFVGHRGGYIFRYDNGVPNSLRALASGFDQGAMPLAVSPDQSVIYFAEKHGKVYRVDAEDGTTTLLADMSVFPLFFDIIAPLGMAVFAPPPPEPIPAVSHWGVIALALSIPVIFRLMNTWRVER